MKDPGFWIDEGVFTEAECDRIIKLVSKTSDGREKAGARNLMAVPEIADVCNDRRLLSITHDLTGSQLTPYKATLFAKTGKANWLVAWHQDTALPVVGNSEGEGWGPSSRKQGVTFAHAPTWALSKILAIRLHLDASVSTNGPLRVIPGSHHHRLQTDVEHETALKLGAVVECTVGVGGIIAMSPLILHASSKSLTDAPRRVLHIEYAPSLDLGRGIRLAIA